MADKKTSQSGDKEFQSFLGLMQSAMDKRESDALQQQEFAAPTANGPTPQVRKVGRPKKDALDKVAESLNILVTRDKRWHDDEASDKDSQQRKTEAWRQKVLDLLEGNVGKQKGKTGGGGAGLIGGAIAALFGKLGVGKVFSSLGRVVQTIVKGGKLFARVLGKAGSTLVEVTKLIGEAVKNPGKFFKSIGSKIGSIGKSVFRRLSGGAGRTAALGEEAAEGAGVLGAAGAAGKVGKLGKLGKAGSLLGKGVSKAIPLAGAAFAGADLASQLHEEYEKNNDTQGIGIGGIANGAMSGGAIGASVGSIIPGVGTAIGAGTGALLGGGASAIMQHKKAIMDELDKMGSGLKETFSSVTDFMGKIWNGSKVTWERVLYPRIEALGSGLHTVWTKLEPVMATVGKAISGITKGVESTVTGILNLFQPLLGSIKTLLEHGGRWLLHRAGISDADISSISEAFSQGPISSASAADTVQQPPQASSSPSPAASQSAETEQTQPGEATVRPVAPMSNQQVQQFTNQPTALADLATPRASSQPMASVNMGSSNPQGPIDHDRALAALAFAESSNIATAKNPHSSATGLWQITSGTLKGINHNHGTHFTMADMKDPHKAYQAEALLHAEESKVTGNDLGKMAALHVLGQSNEWNKWVRGNPNWEATLRQKAAGGNANAKDAVRDIDVVRQAYGSGKGLIDVAALRDGQAVATASSPSDSAMNTTSPAGAHHLGNIANTLNRQVAMMREHHQESMRQAQAQNQTLQADDRGFDWQGVPVSVAQPDIQRMLSKRA